MKYNISYSFLSDIIKKGVLYAINRKENRKQEYNFGSAYHCFVLEPEKFDKLYITYEGTKRNKEYKELLEENDPQYLMPSDDLAKMQDMKEALFKNDDFMKYYKDAEREVTIEKEIDGVNWKGILDLHNEFLNVGIDLKTGSTDTNEIARSIFKYNYDIQYYIYTNLANLKEFYFVFQETEYPYYSRFVSLDSEWWDTGEKKTLDAYHKYLNHETIEEEEPILKTVEIKRAGYMTYEEETEHPAINWEN